MNELQADKECIEKFVVMISVCVRVCECECVCVCVCVCVFVHILYYIVLYSPVSSPQFNCHMISY